MISCVIVFCILILLLLFNVHTIDSNVSSMRRAVYQQKQQILRQMQKFNFSKVGF